MFQVILAKGQTDKEIRKRKLAVEEKEDEQKKERKDTSEMSTDIASGEKVEFFLPLQYKVVYTLKCLSIGTPNTSVCSKWKMMVLGVPVFKHIIGWNVPKFWDT